MFIGVKNARRSREQRRQNVNRVLEANVQRNQRPTTPQPHQQQQNGEAALLQQQQQQNENHNELEDEEEEEEEEEFDPGRNYFKLRKKSNFPMAQGLFLGLFLSM